MKTIENGTKEISNAALLELDCDILIPAALENTITWNDDRKVAAFVSA